MKTGPPGNALRLIRRPEYRALAAASWSVSWPMILIMVFEFLMGLTDVYIAGRLGKEYQAAVGVATQMYFVFIVIANALTVGSVSLVSRLHASGDREALSGTIYTIYLSVLVSGLFLGILGFMLTPFIVSNLNIPGEVGARAIPLIRFLALGLPFHYFLINSNGVLRATGGVRRSLATMAVACVANIALNFLLVFHTALGYYGITLSTAVSVTIGAFINIPHSLRFMAGSRRFLADGLRKVFSVGWPMGVQQVSWQVGSMVLFLILSALPRHNVEVMAAFTNGLRIESAVFLPAYALNMANAVISGNLLGRREGDEAFRSGIITGIIGVALITLLTAIVVLNARSIAMLLSGNEVVVRECIRYIYISMISEPFMAWAVILSGSLSGAGDTRSVMMIVVFGFWLVRIPLAVLLGIVAGWGAPAVWWAMNASIFTHAFFVTVRYFRRKWLEL